MPRVDRLVRKKPEVGRLTPEKKSWLLHGDLFVHSSPFESPAEARRCWIDNREELMNAAKRPPGTRPSAWWKFEQKVTTGLVLPIDQIALLLDRHLIGDQEAAHCERSYACLSGDLAYCEGIGGLAASLRRSNVERLAHEFATAQKWHEWRNRPELVAKYTRLAGELREHLEMETEKETVYE